MKSNITPQSVSRKLTQGGHRRATLKAKGLQKGLPQYPGFEVAALSPTRVRVDYRSPMRSEQMMAASLDAFSETLREAGYTVTSDYNFLIVTRNA